jgi:hypothetical protein
MMSDPAVLLQDVGRTDVLLAAIGREVTRHRDEIENDDGLRTLTVTVRINRGTGLPRAVVVSRESEQDYTRDA